MTSRDQTLTAVQSPLAPGEQKDRAVLLMVGSAEMPGLPARTRLQILGDELVVGRRAPDELRPGAHALVLADGVVSGQHARLLRAPGGGYEVEDLGSKNGTWLDNAKLTERTKLRDGALLFFGNHAGVFRLASSLEVEACKAELVNPLGPVATVSPALATACDRLRRLSASEGELFIVGETGVGKEVYARAVHQKSGRKGRFMAINCAAIPRELVESELFGYRAGAHSTAHQAKPGLIEEAEGGTLFLDEIGEMSAEAQTKLLRFLQDRELTPLGATRPRRMDVRIIAATNRTSGLTGASRGPGGLTCRRSAAASRTWARSLPTSCARPPTSPSISRRSARCACTRGRSTCASSRRS
jgi:pSer/pThr/pTyr-binding forkhead associated (FHA) protein